MNHDTVDTIDINPNLRVRIEYDTDPGSPRDWDNVGEIAYCSSRETLGSENVSRDRLDEISDGIVNGSLIGMPVYAYCHGGATISTKPFSCPWDSGQSGFVYCTKEKAIKEFGKKLMTKNVLDRTLKCLECEVDIFAQYLEGDVYGIIVERVIRDEDGDETDTEELDSCWGFYGLEYARTEAETMGDYQAKQDVKEAAEAQHWAERDVATV